MTEQVIRVRPAIREDRYGDPQPDWEAATRTPFEVDQVAPGATDEDNARRTAEIDQFTLYADIDIDLEATDRVEVRGQIHEVHGNPRRWRRPGGPEGAVISTRRVAG